MVTCRSFRGSPYLRISLGWSGDRIAKHLIDLAPVKIGSEGRTGQVLHRFGEILQCWPRSCAGGNHRTTFLPLSNYNWLHTCARQPFPNDTSSLLKNSLPRSGTE
jgi:hypothetical protein